MGRRTCTENRRAFVWPHRLRRSAAVFLVIRQSVFKQTIMSTDALIYIHVIGCVGLFVFGYYMGSRKKD